MTIRPEPPGSTFPENATSELFTVQGSLLFREPLTNGIL
jgi:hypothetical protein